MFRRSATIVSRRLANANAYQNPDSGKRFTSKRFTSKGLSNHPDSKTDYGNQDVLQQLKEINVTLFMVQILAGISAGSVIGKWLFVAFE